MCERKETEFLQDTTNWFVTPFPCGVDFDITACEKFNGSKLLTSIVNALHSGYPDMSERDIEKCSVAIAIQVCEVLRQCKLPVAELYPISVIVDTVAKMLFSFDKFYAAKEYILQHCCDK